jgi:hypothetical protein
VTKAAAGFAGIRRVHTNRIYEVDQIRRNPALENGASRGARGDRAERLSSCTGSLRYRE